jgi:hypothetical protein
MHNIEPISEDTYVWWTELINFRLLLNGAVPTAQIVYIG